MAVPVSGVVWKMYEEELLLEAFYQCCVRSTIALERAHALTDATAVTENCLHYAPSREGSSLSEPTILCSVQGGNDGTIPSRTLVEAQTTCQEYGSRVAVNPLDRFDPHHWFQASVACRKHQQGLILRTFPTQPLRLMIHPHPSSKGLNRPRARHDHAV